MRRHLTRLALAVLCVLAVATDPPSAHAATSADRLMAGIASHQTMGWQDNRTSYETLEARIANGGRVYASCSIVAELGYRAAVRAHIPARHVSAVTNAKFDRYNDGHAMVELRLGGHWVLYDLDLNRKAVDPHGHGVDLAYQVRAGEHRHWQVIAHDEDRWNFAGTDAKTRRMVAPFAHMTPERWYRHALGVALIEQPNGIYAYHGDGHDSARIDKVWPGRYKWVNATTWRSLNA